MNEEKSTKLAKYIKRQFDELTPAAKNKVWMFWPGDRLVKAARNLGSGASFLEALWLAEGRLTKKERLYAVSARDFEKLYVLAQNNPEAYDLLAEICSSTLCAGSDLSKNQRAVAGAILQGVMKRPKRSYAGQTLFEEGLLTDTVAKTAALVVVIIAVNTAWLGFGSLFSRLLSRLRTGRMANIGFAIMLIVSVGLALSDL
ncbi:hypothetical protein RXV86_12525 [Alisedimentitalea sp. MJ-SS2]|uniref:hypothetical protein n=1 Tax=Aliisedimentitalea sp. MJ-SS2 TaxID=3049795 RepID=UPI00290D996D|nr:hypothetical protein [Alisedimentitalea sp. MJ-SS2]MDU8928214.1 hypothetical protein [Alisedimentitalea sp. MJ-SS2]